MLYALDQINAQKDFLRGYKLVSEKIGAQGPSIIHYQLNATAIGSTDFGFVLESRICFESKLGICARYDRLVRCYQLHVSVSLPWSFNNGIFH